MTIDLDKPTRRRTKSLEEQVAEADAIPWPEPQTPEAFGIAFEDLEPNPDHFQETDSGELEMTPEAMAELRARAAHMGLGGPNGSEPSNVLVTGYDANGESIDVEVERSARAQEAAATGEPDLERPPVRQIEMPGFEGHKATKVTVSFSGSIVLDLGYAAHKALWDSLGWQRAAALNISVFVNGKGFKAGKDATAGASLTVLSARLAISDSDDEEDVPDDDGPLDDADGPDDPLVIDPDDDTSEPLGTALDEALAIADDGDA